MSVGKVLNEAETFEVRAEVFAVIPEYHQAVTRSPDGHWHLTITQHTKGVLLNDVQEGQVYLLTVGGRFNRVLHAKLVDPEAPADESFKQS